MATGQNLDEHIEAQEIAYLKKNEKLESRKANFKKRNIVFGGIFLALIVVIFALDLGDKNDSYNSFKDVNITDTEKITEIANSSELLGYADLYSKYENAYLGNRGFHSLNYGLLAENQYGYTCLNENNQTVLNANGKETIVNTEPISQVNIANNKVIYRGADRKLYSSNYDGTEKANIVNDNVGTVLLVGKDIYYVNYSKGNNLYKYSLEGQEPALVLEANIKTFTIVADTILYLDYSNNLYLTSFQGVNKWTLANVNKFYFNGRVYVQNNDKVISFNLNKHYPKDVISGITELLGVDEENLYYSIEDKVYAHNLSTGKTLELPYAFDYYKGVYNINGEDIAIGGKVHEDY
ncbi:DUF5050 domain-containing protein [Oscillibacter ruminantium]|uniref:DUF5050 domain-containing protein n=1 Tax=Oscillibacter ruminantium TaxID=1263547 RepID=UPI0002F3385A|nr:DUF5050 domain-containing protein [Oscillibacter ruminantium]